MMSVVIVNRKDSALVRSMPTHCVTLQTNWHSSIFCVVWCTVNEENVSVEVTLTLSMYNYKGGDIVTFTGMCTLLQYCACVPLLLPWGCCDTWPVLPLHAG